MKVRLYVTSAFYLDEAEDADPPEVSAGVCPLEPDGLPVRPVPGAVLTN